MVRRPGGYELIVGAPRTGSSAGAAVRQGGTSAELVRDQASPAAAQHAPRARGDVAHPRLRTAAGYRGAPAANLDALALTLMRVAQLVIDHAEVASSTSTRCSPTPTA